MQSIRWTGLSAIVMTSCQLVQVIVATRFLSVSDYGLYSLSVVVLAFFREFSDGAVNLSLVQRQKTSELEVSSAFWSIMIIGVFLFVLVWCGAPAISAAYGLPELTFLLRLGALTLLLIPIGQIQSALLEKDLCFAKLAKVEAAASVLGIASAVALVIEGHGVTSFVVGLVTAQLGKSVLLLATCWNMWRPRLKFSYGAAKPVIIFGAYVYGSRMLNFVYLRSDQLLIAYFFGAGALGYYTLAWNCTVDPVYRLNPVLNRVCFPLFARVQMEAQRLRRGYLKGLAVVAGVNFPVVGGVALVAPVAVPLVFGPDWHQAVPLIQVLAANAAARAALNFTSSTLPYAKGRANYVFYWLLASTLVQFPLVFLSASAGSPLVVAATVASVTACATASMYPLIVRRLVGNCLGPWLAALALPAALVGVMAIAVHAVVSGLDVSHEVQLAVMVLVGLSVYLCGIILAMPFLKKIGGADQGI